MQEKGPSRTALGAAAHRAAHQIVDRTPLILNDPVIVRLIDPAIATILREGGGGAEESRTRGLRTHIVLRSRFAEDRLSAAAGRGVRQYVVLGAGLDTFAYRQPAWASGVRVFEVDHPATQADKRARLASAGIEPPANLEFVGIDFEVTGLEAGLAASGLDFSRPAVFACLGVLIYLSAPAVEAVFRLVSGFPTASEIVFTFASQPLAASPIAQAAALAGEPWLTEMQPETLERSLRAMGFGRVGFLTPGQAAATYFPTPRADGLTAPRRVNIGYAVVA